MTTLTNHNDYISTNIIKNLSQHDIKFDIIDENTVRIKDAEVVDLKTYMDENVCLYYDQCEDLMKSIGFFMDGLERNKKTLISIYLEDIVVVNNNCFLFINDEKIVNITMRNTIDVSWVDKNDFNCDELKSISILPNEIHYKSVYQNLAFIVFYALFGDTILNRELMLNNLALNGYANTKLYYSINRCSNQESCKREFIWV